MSPNKLFQALNLYGLPPAKKMTYARNKSVDLPSCCLVNEKGHFLLYQNGAHYDNIQGAFTEYDFTQPTSCLEILA